MRMSQVAVLLALSLFWGVTAAEGQSPPLMSISWQVTGGQASASFGGNNGGVYDRRAVAGVDVNGDGYGDVVVGSPLFDNSQQNEGRISVYLGSASGLGTTPAWTAESDKPLAEFGGSLANAGDVNGDGFSDIIVGSRGYRNIGGEWVGAAFVWHGSAAGLGPNGTPANADWMAEGDEAFSFGFLVATAGDVNGDGYSDVILSDPLYDLYGDGGSEGRVVVYHGSASGLAASPAWTIDGGPRYNGYGLGFSVATAGDVNGDGYSDVIISDVNASASGEGAGRAFVYHGSASGLATSPAWVGDGDGYYAGFGWSVATAGDVNGDGFSDVVVGTRNRAFVFEGAPSGLAETPSCIVEGDSTVLNDPFATNSFHLVATAGDVNGDGFDDVLVGLPWVNNPEFQKGRVVLFLGSARGMSPFPMWTAEGDQAWVQFGNSFSAAGDVDADGFDDVIIGAPGYSNGYGKAFVYSGHSVPLGHVTGTVFVGGAPLSNVTIDLVQMGSAPEESHPIGFVATDAAGTFAAMNVPQGEIEVSIVIPLGYEAVAPATGSALVVINENQTTTQNFTLALVPDAGPARSMGYWKHQVNVHMLGRGRAQETYESMSGTYPQVIYDHFYMNAINPIRIDGVTSEGGYQGVPLTLGRMQLSFNESMWGPHVNAARQLLAVFLNAASNRLRTTDVVSEDGGTASQAIQQAAELFERGGQPPYDPADYEAAKDIAETLNEGRTFPAGVIDLYRPVIPFAPHAAPSASFIGVRPNPMANSSSFAFDVASPGNASVKIFDVSGRLVRTLLDGELPSGRHSAVWDARGDDGRVVANGVYFYRIETPGGGPLTARFVVMH